MKVRFSKELEDYVRAQVGHGSFVDVGEFIQHCVREHRDAELAAVLPDLRVKLVEGLKSKSHKANPKTLASDMQRRHRATVRKAA